MDVVWAATMAMAICYITDGRGYSQRTARGPRPRVPAVLVVDDEATVRDMVRDVLEDEGLRVHTATSGREAIILAIRERPDLIVTDLMMPGMTGRTLRLHLQAEPRTRHIPVMLMTAGGRLPVEDTFAGYIAKPFDIDDFLNEVLSRITL